MQETTQENTEDKRRQEALSGRRSPGQNASARLDFQPDYEEAPEDTASLLALELRRKDAHIAKLEAMLRQAEGMPAERERRPEAFLPTNAPMPADMLFAPSDTLSASPNGAMVYDAPSVAPKTASDGANSRAAAGANRVGGAMVYEAPPPAPRNARIRLEDMGLEHSPIAQVVMQAAARRLTEPVPVFEPTLRMSNQAARQPGSPRSVQDNPARRRQILVVSALGLLAFAGVIGASHLRAPHGEPVLIAPPPPIDMVAFAAAPVKVSKPVAASATSTIDLDSSSIEILPAAPAPQTIKRFARHTGSAHIAAVSRLSSPDPEPLPPSSPTVPRMQYPVRAVHIAQPRVHAAVSAAHIRKSAAPSFQAETSGVIAEAGEERADVASSSHSDTSLPTDSAEAAASAHRAEVLPDDTRDTYGDSRVSDYRVRRRRYRYSQTELTETRRSAYKYGEGTNRRTDDDAEFARRSARGYNERTDAWTDERPDR